MRIVAQQGPPVQGEGPDTDFAPSDPRVNAFVRLVNAVDAADPTQGIKACRELRRLGYSVCLTTPRSSQAVPR